MKISKNYTDKGIHVIVTASIKDMYNADLMRSITINQLYPSGYQYIQSGRLMNYFSNLLITSAIEDGDMMLLSSERPKYRIIGDDDNFAEFHFFFPRAGKNVIKSGSEDLDIDYKTPFGSNLKQPDGWDYKSMKSMK
jgi:hypothetical protein